MNAVTTALVAALTLFGLVPAGAQSYHGISCDDVRMLSGAERVYWSDRLNLSAEQRHHIYVACYQNQFASRDHGSDPIK
jgi:hypothetical protein